MDNENRDNSFSYTTFNKKMMLVSVVFLFIACFFIVLFHWYARCFQSHRRQRRPLLHAVAAVILPKGLPTRVLNSLPTFTYDSKLSRDSPIECVVCLSEFEDKEMGRILPDCKHCFHVDCIDMWLHSHRDCPLCRAEVKAHHTVKNPAEVTENGHQIVIDIPQPTDTGLDSDSGFHPTCQNDATRMTCSSCSPSTAPEVPAAEQLTDPTASGPIQAESLVDRASNIGYGPDIESGPKPIILVGVLKRLFRI